MSTYRGMNAETGQWIDDIDHVRQSIHKIITTLFNTRVMRRELFSIIPELIDQPFNRVTRLRLMAATAGAVIEHETRVRPVKVTIEQGSEASSWVVDLTVTLATGLRAGESVDLSILLRA